MLQTVPDAPLISPLVRFEVEQSAWFTLWLFKQNHPRGLRESAVQAALASFSSDLENKVWNVVTPDWASMLDRAERLAIAHTPRHGARCLDLLHIASALELGASEFLSFDLNQRRVAEAEGLTVLP